MIEKIAIYTEYIKLDSFLKLANISYSGGEAKCMIQDGMVLVNGDVCTMRGKKLHEGDIIQIADDLDKYQVCKE